MKEEYQAWINALTPDQVNGKCSERTLEMQERFPELRRVRGHVYLALCPEPRSHWWLEDEDGNIIDPTIKQFTDPTYIYGGVCAVLSYEEYTGPEPLGKCMNCGDISFYTDVACSEHCVRELEEYFGWCGVER